MKKNLLFLVVALVGIICSGKAMADNNGNDKKSLIINPAELKIKVGNSQSFKVKCTEEKNAQVQDNCDWQVIPDSLGHFNGPEFMADIEGNGLIIAVYKEFSDTISLKVIASDKKDKEENKKDDDKGHDKNDYPKITFKEKHLSLSVGESESFHPTYWLAKDSSVEVAFQYSVDPVILGAVSENGVFNAEHVGNGKITVSVDSVSSTLRVQVKNKNDKKEDVFPKLEIATKRLNIKSGEYAELMAVYADSTGDVSTVYPEWTIVPAELGHFVDSIFYADSVGKGILLASYMGMVDSITLNVQEGREVGNVWSAYQVSIIPGDTTIAIGNSVKFSLAVFNKKNWQLEIDSTLLDSITVDWSVVGQDVGSISEDGVFTASQKGFALVKAKLNGEKALTTRIMVDEAIDDSTGINSVEFQRVLPNGNILPSKMVKEGDAFKIGGLPFPLNVLNGGLLYFPVGSLKEDISIFMMLPEQIVEDSSDVVLGDSILGGIKFVVAVGDSIVEPYYFEQPLILSVPYKIDLLDSLGIEPEQIGMFFSEDGDYTNLGVGNVMIDTVQNRIIAEVEHFSSLVVRKSTEQITAVQTKEVLQTEKIVIAPNPFVYQTTLHLNLAEESNVEFVIYDLTGKLVRTFKLGKVNSECKVQWDATDKNGVVVKSGMYIGQVIVNGKSISTSKMIKLGL